MSHVPASRHPLIQYSRIKHILSPTELQPANTRWSLMQAKEGVTRLLRLHENTIQSDKRLEGPRIGARPRHPPFDRIMKSHIQFLTTPTADTPGTGLILHFDDKRYFFGQVHEGLQRAGLQHGAKFLRAREFFLTGKTHWQNTGGMLGLILTLADSAKAAVESMKEINRKKRDRALELAKKEEEDYFRTAKPGQKRKPRNIRRIPEILELGQPTLGIHGGPNITHTVATARSFVFRQGMPMDVDEFAEGTERTGPEQDWQPTWADDHIQVWAMPIAPTKAQGGATTPRPLSPRKRSLGEYMSSQRTKDRRQKALPDALDGLADEAQRVRERVVHEMFRSNWRFDNLVETPLAQVKMPAKIFARDPETKNLGSYDGPLPGGNEPLPEINVFVRNPWPGATVTDLPSTKPSSTSMSYIVRNYPQRGKFDAIRAKELGVPPGPMNRELTQGRSVNLEDGKVVTPEMVLEPGKEGNGVAIIDLPSREYVSALLHRPEWYEEKVMIGVEAIIWILGPGVAQDELLIQFMKEFKEFRHIVSSSEYCMNQLMMTSAACAHVRHHLIDPQRYSLLVHQNVGVVTPSVADDGSKFVVARPGLKLQLEPSIELQEDEVVHPVNLVQEANVSQAVYRLANQAKHNLSAELQQFKLDDQELPSPEAEVVCLGTGSAMPSMHRNVSGTLLRIPGVGSYLFDAGENTLGQLRRIYSSEELAQVWRDLKMIWISHLHADHHLGTVSVIKAWYEEVHGANIVKRPRPSLEDQLLNPAGYLDEGRRLFIVGGRQMMRWLYEYSSVEDFGYDQVVPLEAMPSRIFEKPRVDEHVSCPLEWNGVDVGFKSSKDEQVTAAMRNATGIHNLATCGVAHCHGAMAVSVTFLDGFKFSYSGDCRPSKDFTHIGRDSTVLVHEATFDDDMKGDAIVKKHSTISEAVGVGLQMNARRIILTHFSQRYSKIPTMKDIEGATVGLEESPSQSDVGVGAIEAGNLEDAIPPQRAPFKGKAEKVKVTVPDLPPNKDIKICVAFDYMRVRVKDIACLEKFTPALRELYKEEEQLPVLEKRKISLADGGGARSVAKQENASNGRSRKGSKSSQSAENVNRAWDASKVRSTRMEAEIKAGIGRRPPGSLVRQGGKPNLKRKELVNRLEDNGEERNGDEPMANPLSS